MRTIPRLGILFVLALATGLLWPSPKPASGTVVGGEGRIAAGSDHTCAMTEAGGAICWGKNENGQLGDGATAHRTTPVVVSGLGDSSVAAVTAGAFHTCALTTDGGVLCWGRNTEGQLGDATQVDRATPVAVSGLPGVVAVAAGGFHTCALTETRGVTCWGNNSSGQLGDGQICGNVCTTPVGVVGLTSGVAAIAAGLQHSCAVLDTGIVKCWGSNTVGQLGDGTNADSATPVDVAGAIGSAIAAGGAHTCALTDGASVRCWGENDSGQLGDGTDMNRRTPIDVSGLPWGFRVLAAGFKHTCVILEPTGMACWGNNSLGQLGDGRACGSTCPSPVAVSGLAEDVAAVAMGFFHTCALGVASSLQCWGLNDNGQLGEGRACFVLCDTPLDVLLDSDGDGCLDRQELGVDPLLGGLRDPKSFWDFFDPSRDRAVSLQDFLQVLARFGSVGDPTVDPLSAPPPPPAYHPRFDRGGQTPGSDPWDELPANGSIGLADFLALLRQFGHTCV